MMRWLRWTLVGVLGLTAKGLHQVNSRTGVTVVVLCCTAFNLVMASPQNVAEAVFGGEVTLASARSAETVTVSQVHQKRIELHEGLLKDLPDEDALPTRPHILPMYSVEPPVAISRDDAASLKSLLSDPKSYLWYSDAGGPVKMCLPDYGFLFTFQTSPRNIRIALWLQCAQIAVFTSDGDDPIPVNAETDVDFILPKLIDILKRTYPADKSVQALSVEHCDDMGHGFRSCTLAEMTRTAFGTFDHKQCLYYGEKKLGEYQGFTFAPDGEAVVWQGLTQPDFFLFRPKEGKIRVLTQGVHEVVIHHIASGVPYKWSSDGQTLDVYQNGEKWMTLRIPPVLP